MESSTDSPRALLPLKKGRREGFLAMPFQRPKPAQLPMYCRQFRGSKFSCQAKNWGKWIGMLRNQGQGLTYKKGGTERHKLDQTKQVSFLKSRKISLHQPFLEGEKVERNLHCVPKSSPPFKKGRTGWISGQAFSKGYSDTTKQFRCHLSSRLTIYQIQGRLRDLMILCTFLIPPFASSRPIRPANPPNS